MHKKLNKKKNGDRLHKKVEKWTHTKSKGILIALSGKMK
jgi:hypothetical protein